MSPRRLIALSLVLAACPAPKPAPTQPSPLPATPIAAPTPAPSPEAPPSTEPPPESKRLPPGTIADAKAKLVAKHGEAQRARIERGVDQVAKLWRNGDGDFVAFCVEQFVPAGPPLDVLFTRLESLLEQVDGHFQELGRTARWATEVESGPLQPVDSLTTAYDAGAHVTEDMFATKVAFAALLNFPLVSLADRLRDGAQYSRRMWAEVRLTGRFDTRIPGALAAAHSAAESSADQYVAGYNLWMHHVLGEDGVRRFPSNKRLISHWNLRDELKANYADKDGLAKQRTIAKVMERIVTQTIPRAVIDNPRLDWNPFSNVVSAAPADQIEADAPKDRPTAPSADREPDLRFEHIREHLRAERAIDPFAPIAPTYMDRAFEAAEMPEARVRSILEAVLGSPLVPEVAKEIEAKLGRKLEPHDLWYAFKGNTAEADLDKVTRAKYPTAAAFAADIPRILRQLGFSGERAKYLADHIAVDPSRGAGHAMEAKRRGDKAHLRTRVEPGGMDYKGYNIAVHELGHNIEQTFSLYDIDHTLLAGVPNTAFTEALAFLFQARDRELLGRKSPGAEADRQRVLEVFWGTWEIAGSALVEIDVWHWLYAHPNATAAEIREATVNIARGVWDRYYAPVLGGKGTTTLLGIYSHTLTQPLYLFNYVLGHTIAFQVEQLVAGKSPATFAKEFERVARLGRITPDLWMTTATGKPVGAEPLLEATQRALRPVAAAPKVPATKREKCLEACNRAGMAKDCADADGHMMPCPCKCD